MGIEEHDNEGRLITLEMEDFYLVCCYTPNSQDGLKRLDYRMQWETDLREYLMQLDAKKPVVYCGDLNVAHKEIDLKNPKTNRMNAGFTDEEREKMTVLLESGFTDTFRFLHPDEKDIVLAIVEDEMQNAISLSVPLIADYGWGTNWLEAH
jgi:exodeoxyribonuclease-3